VSGFGATPAGMLAGAAFTLLLGVACASDLRSRRIPNGIVGTIALGGLVYALGTMAPLAAIEYAIGGSALGLVLWVPFWVGRVLGAGDVKLVAASGAWLGAAGVLEASLLAAAAGGVLAVWALSRQGGVSAGAARFGAWMMASRVTGTLVEELTPHERRVPYGLAIAVGAVAAAWFPRLIW
jgi:prepilin peptidase CpaA